MATGLISTGIQFPSGLTQTTNVTGAADLGELLAVSTYPVAAAWNWTPSQPVTTSAAVTWNAIGAGTALTVTGTDPYTITNGTPASNWTQSVYSTQTGVNVFVQARPSQTGNNIMFGLTRTAGASYSAIEYAIYYNSDGTLRIYESGADVGQFGTYIAGDIGIITYDGSYIRYYCDVQGTRPIRVVAVSGLTGLKAQVSMFNGGSVYGVQFGACSQIQGSKAVVKLVGAGGGAAGYCESGGAGGYAEEVIDTTAVNSVNVTIGGGGTAVTYYTTGGNGGTTSFGAYCSASGGGGANTYSAHSGGFGGIGSGGNINLRGSAGCGHVNSVGYWAGGRGGYSYFGGSASFNRETATKTTVGSPGAGGPGGRTNENGTGGVGENGLVVVYTYK